MKKIKEFIPILWSNSTLLKTRFVPLWLVMIFFVVNVSLVSVPNYFGLLQGIDSISYLEEIEETFTLMYESEIPCKVSFEHEMTCGVLPNQIGSYLLIYQEEVVTQGTTQSTIFIGKNQMAIVYVQQATSDEEQDVAYIVTGDYRLLGGFDFTQIKTNEHQFDARSDYYEYATDLFLTNLYYSGLGDQTFLVFASQFSQMLIFLVVISIMFMILNYRTRIKKITYMAATKIIICSMTGPALLSAILGVFLMGWASILFIALFALRIMFLYYRINRTEETLY